LIGVVLLGGWLLLFHPEGDAPPAPAESWERVRKYDTAWLCEQGRHEEAVKLSERTAKEQGRQGSDMLNALLRYRCEYTDRTRWLDTVRWKVRDWARWRPW